MARWDEKFDKAKEHISRDVGSFLEATVEIHSIAKELGSEQQVLLKEMTDKLGGIQKIVGRGQMKVVFFGRTSNGKSTVINALLGAKVLPSACGSVSSCFCSIQKRPNKGDTTCQGMAKIGGAIYDNLDSARSLASHLSREHPNVEELLEIYWPAQQCKLLEADVVLVDSPGIGADHNTDRLINQNCQDADIFVYVCNGIATLERQELDFLLGVNKYLSKPSNLFILINHWDAVVRNSENDEVVSSVRDQHIKVFRRFLTDELKVTEETSPKERVFFVSAQEVVTIQGAGPDIAREDYKIQIRVEDKWEEREKEFKRFKETLKDCLTETAVETKFGRHCEECRECLETAVENHCPGITVDINHKREKYEKEIIQLKQEIKDLEEGESELATKYGEMTRKLEADVKCLVKKAVDDTKPVFDKEINDNDLKIDSKKPEKYLKQLCDRIQPKVDDVTESLHRELKEKYRSFVVELKGVFQEHIKRSPKVEESITGLPPLPDCRTLAGDYVPSFGFHEHLIPNSLGEAGVGVGSGLFGSAVGLAMAVALPIAAPIVAGVATFAGIYGAYKTTTWHKSDNWKRGINGKINGTLKLRLDKEVKALQGDYVSKFEDSLEEANGCFSKEFVDAKKFKEDSIKDKQKHLSDLKELESNLSTVSSKLWDVKERLESFDKKFLQESTTCEDYWLLVNT